VHTDDGAAASWPRLRVQREHARMMRCREPYASRRRSCGTTSLAQRVSRARYRRTEPTALAARGECQHREACRDLRESQAERCDRCVRHDRRNAALAPSDAARAGRARDHRRSSRRRQSRVTRTDRRWLHRDDARVTRPAHRARSACIALLKNAALCPMPDKQPDESSGPCARTMRALTP
jgi:hypothetical protein